MTVIHRACAIATTAVAAAIAVSGALAGTTAQAQPAGLELITPDIDATRPKADEVNFAIVSDHAGCSWGEDTSKCADQWAVADMIRSWNPDFILTAGDNDQQQATEEQVQRSIKPYLENVEAGNIFPIFGNHDYGNSCDAEGAKYTIQYWGVPTDYRAVFGNGLVEWLNPNGACQTGTAANPPAIYDDYIASVNNSEATWVLTGVHQPPYSTGKSGNNTNRHWVINDGVDLVVSGHDHHSEFISNEDGEFVITGNGGDGTTGLYTPTTGSQWRQNDNLGAMRVKATAEQLHAEFVALGGEVMYEFILQKNADGTSDVVYQTPWEPPVTEAPTTGVPAKSEVSFDIAAGTSDDLTPLQYPDGPWEYADVDGRKAIQLTKNPSGGGNHLYLDVADEAMSGGPYDVEMEISYRSDVAGSFVIQYENAETGAAYDRSLAVTISADQVGQWQTATVPLPSANFNNRQNGSADMRLMGSSNLPLQVSAITIRSTGQDERVVSMHGNSEHEGLSPIEYPSGPFSYVTVDGTQAIRMEDRTDGATTNNLYLSVDDRIISGGPFDAWATITYRSEEAGRFAIQYDDAASGAAYFNPGTLTIDEAQVGQWQTVTIPLPQAMFQNRQNGSADLRIIGPGGTNLLISEMQISLFDPANPPFDEEPGVTGEDVSWTAAKADGLNPIPYESGPFSIVDLDGEQVLRVDKNPVNVGNNLYMGVDDLRIHGGPHKVWLVVEYMAPVAGRWTLQYDDATSGAAYHDAEAVAVTDDMAGKWQTAMIPMPAAMFQNRQNGDADFRLRGVDNLPMYIRSMEITFTEPVEEPTPDPVEDVVTSVAAATVAPAGRIANVWGTASPNATVSTQVRLPDGTWSTSQTRVANDEGGYVIPLTYGWDVSGIYEWRVVVAHESGQREISKSFTQRRVAAPTATSAGVARVGQKANVWGTVDGQSHAKVWTEVFIPGQGWSTSQIGATKAGGGYVLPVTYGQHAPSTYRWRVAAEYEGIGILRSAEFTFERR